MTARRSTCWGGKAGSLAAFVVAAHMKGTPMVYNDQEVGTPQRLPFFQGRQVLDWSRNPDITLAYKRIRRLRNAGNAVRNGTLASYSTDDVCAFTKTADNEPSKCSRSSTCAAGPGPTPYPPRWPAAIATASPDRRGPWAPR